jgi:hypothetical protein
MKCSEWKADVGLGLGSLLVPTRSLGTSRLNSTVLDSSVNHLPIEDWTPRIYLHCCGFRKSRETNRPVSPAFSHFAELFQNISLVVFRVFLERPIGMSRFPGSFAVFWEIVFPDFRFVWSIWGFFVDGGWWSVVGANFASIFWVLNLSSWRNMVGRLGMLCIPCCSTLSFRGVSQYSDMSWSN